MHDKCWIVILRPFSPWLDVALSVEKRHKPWYLSHEDAPILSLVGCGLEDRIEVNAVVAKDRIRVIARVEEYQLLKVGDVQQSEALVSMTREFASFLIGQAFFRAVAPGVNLAVSRN